MHALDKITMEHYMDLRALYFFDLRVNGSIYHKTYNGTLLGSQGRSFEKDQHDPCNLTLSPKKWGLATTKLHFSICELSVNGSRYKKTYKRMLLRSQGSLLEMST
jgi:hypothetical protein